MTKYALLILAFALVLTGCPTETEDVAVTGVSLDKTTHTLTLPDNATVTLAATVLPAGATNKDVTWESSDNDIAEVDNNGNVTAQTEGTVTITVKSKADESKTAECVITVNGGSTTNDVAVASISLDKSTHTLTLPSDATVTLAATVLPDNATNKDVTWTSSDDTVASVVNGVVTAKTAGTATITVTSNADNTKTAQCAITVSRNKVIWLVGDSTVSAFNDAYYYPRYGYGTKLGDFFDSGKIAVENLARSGRSSLDFFKEDANYAKLFPAEGGGGIQAGDVLIIGFGHNDEKTEAARYTNPNGNHNTEGSFQYSLYENYIKKAEAADATVIVNTPIVRRTRSGTWSNNDLHITAGAEGFPGGDYKQAVIDLGAAVNVPVVNMMELTKTLYDTLTPTETLYLHAWTSDKEGSVDNTHLNVYGATYAAYLLAKEIYDRDINGLKNFVLADKLNAAPDKATVLVSNPAYVSKPYAPPSTNSALGAAMGIWKPTAFGDTGGAPATANYIFTPDSTAKTISMEVTGNKGKIASAADGLAMYYYKIPAGSAFELSADVLIERSGLDNQTGFGLMVRDDMYIDLYDASIASDYVTAGTYFNGSKAACNNWKRQGGTLDRGTETVTITQGETYKLKLIGTEEGFSAQIGDNPPRSAGFDFQLTAIDTDYMYVGMFAVRNIKVTFSNIVLKVNGVEVTE